MDHKPGSKKIGFNLLPYSFTTHGGAEVYLRSILAALSELNRATQTYSLFVFSFGNVVNEELLLRKGYQEIQLPSLWGRSRVSRILAEQLTLPIFVSKYKIDCLISNYVVPLAAPCTQGVVIHDMLYRRYPEALERPKLLYWQAMIPASIRRSVCVATVSQFSAEEIVTFYPSAKDKLFVTTEGIRPSLARLQSTEATRGLGPQSFLLCVAAFGKHKNMYMLLRAFATLPADCSDLSLVFVGAARTPDSREYQASLKKLIAQLGLSSRVVLTGHVPDAELASLYRNAVALVLPSLYEGFGLPVIEAQYFGCPVLCSSAASLPEIAGPAAIIFDPTSIQSIRDAILTLVNQPQVREQIRQAGYENTSRFSWEKAAVQLIAAVEFAVQQG